MGGLIFQKPVSFSCDMRSFASTTNPCAWVRFLSALLARLALPPSPSPALPSPRPSPRRPRREILEPGDEHLRPPHEPSTPSSPPEPRALVVRLVPGGAAHARSRPPPRRRRTTSRPPRRVHDPRRRGHRAVVVARLDGDFTDGRLEPAAVFPAELFSRSSTFLCSVFFARRRRRRTGSSPRSTRRCSSPAPWMPKTTLASQKKDAWSSTLHVVDLRRREGPPRSSAHRLRSVHLLRVEMVRSAAALRSPRCTRGCLASGFAHDVDDLRAGFVEPTRVRRAELSEGGRWLLRALGAAHDESPNIWRRSNHGCAGGAWSGAAAAGRVLHGGVHERDSSAVHGERGLRVEGRKGGGHDAVRREGSLVSSATGKNTAGARRNDFDRAGGRTFGGRRPEATTEEPARSWTMALRRARTLDVASWTMPRTCFSRSLRKGMCT